MKIIIDEKTPSVNHLYATNKFGKRYMKNEARQLKKRILESVNEQLKAQAFWRDDWINKLLKVRVEIHENWWNKNNTVKTKDISNREKFLIDSVFEALGLDDKFIWEHTLLKVDDENFLSEIKIEKYS